VPSSIDLLCTASLDDELLSRDYSTMREMRELPDEKPTTNLRGIVSMLAAVGSFALMDAGLKRLAADYSPMQVTFLRAVASLPFLLVAAGWSRQWAQLAMRRPVLHLLRGVLGVIMLSTFVYAVSQLSLANTYAVYLCAPLLVTALSVPLLGDRVTTRRWVAIAIGLCGALIVLRPGGDGFVSVAGLAAVLSMVCYSASGITIRILGRTDSNRSMVFWFLLFLALGSGVFAWRDWSPVAADDVLVLAFIGLSGALGQHFITDAFRRAPPSVVAPFEYTALLWAFGLDWMFWRILPTGAVIAGGAVVIASGLYIIADERRGR
jgi:drug/metabolite transporter (DMT)-like permease